LSSNRFLLATIPALLSAAAPADPLTIFFVDPGYAEYSGDAILVCTPDGGYYLVDGGDAGTDPLWDCGETRVLPLLDSLGAVSLDGIVATHPHSDHVGGLIPVIETLPVGRVWDSGWPYSPTPAYTEFLQALESAAVPYSVVRRGDILDWGPSLTVEVLHPAEPLDPDNMNNASIVLRVTYREVSFLLAGDVYTEGGESLIIQAWEAGEIPTLAADVLKVAHHGSSSSTSASWLAAVDPEWAAIEVGEGNPYGHPHGEVISRLLAWGVQIFRTDLEGTFYISTDGYDLYHNSLPPSGGAPEGHLTAYPSPALEYVRFDWPEEAQPTAFAVYNMLGEGIFEEEPGTPPLEWDLSLEGGSRASPGLYAAVLDFVDGNRWTEYFAISR
jgi:competence protein ComEC